MDEEVDGIEDKGLEYVEHVFEICPFHLCSFFSDEKQEFRSWDYSP
jgi:hypothetical protein